MNKRSAWSVGVPVLVVAAFLFVAVNRFSPLVTAAVADEARASARAGFVDGREVGEVLIGRNVVLRVRTSAGGYTPYERAVKVSQRLDAALVGGVKPADIHTSPWETEAVVLAGNALLVTADAQHAYLNSTTPLRLADAWANNLAGALGGRRGGRVQYRSDGSGPSRGGYNDYPPEAGILAIVSPRNGASISSSTMTISGYAPARRNLEVEVFRNGRGTSQDRMMSQTVTSDTRGQWSLRLAMSGRDVSGPYKIVVQLMGRNGGSDLDRQVTFNWVAPRSRR